MPIAWYLAPYKRRSVHGRPGRYCAVDDAGIGDRWQEGEILGGFAVVRVAPEATAGQLDALDALPNVESLRGATLTTRLATLSASRRSRLLELAESFGYTAEELSNWQAQFPDPVLFHLFEFVGQRRRKPRYDEASGSIILDGPIQPVLKPWALFGGAGGEFPTTSLLDQFSRADENPLSGSGNWAGPLWSGDSQCRLVSNQVVGNAGFSESYWNAATFGPDCEAHVTIVTVGAAADNLYLTLRVQSPNSASLDGYEFGVEWAAGTDIVRVSRIDNAVATQLGAQFNQEFLANDRFGAAAIGTSLSPFIYSGGAWNRLGVRHDLTYQAAGYLSLGVENATLVCDDFGGGTFVPYTPPNTFPDYADFPKDLLRR